MHRLNSEAKTAYKSREIIWLYMGLLLITKYLITTSKSLFFRYLHTGSMFAGGQKYGTSHNWDRTLALPLVPGEVNFDNAKFLPTQLSLSNELISPQEEGSESSRASEDSGDNMNVFLKGDIRLGFVPLLLFFLLIEWRVSWLDGFGLMFVKSELLLFLVPGWLLYSTTDGKSSLDEGSTVSSLLLLSAREKKLQYLSQAYASL